MFLFSQSRRQSWQPYARLVLALLLCAICSSASAADQPTANGATAPAEETTEKRPQLLTLELGDFRIQDLRPTRNETLKLHFMIHVQLTDEVTPAMAKQLENWKYRLRSQVITTARATQLIDYIEPDFGHLQRTMLLRLNRTLPKPLIERLFITEFTLGDR